MKALRRGTGRDCFQASLRLLLALGVAAALLPLAHAAEMKRWISLCGTSAGGAPTCGTAGATVPAGAGADSRIDETGDGAIPLPNVEGGSAFGFTVIMGYVNGDRFIDTIVGDPGRSRVYISFGKLATSDAGQSPNVKEPSVSRSSAADVTLIGPKGSRFGFSVAIAKQLPHGPNPVVIGAPSDNGRRGGVYITAPASLTGLGGHACRRISPDAPSNPSCPSVLTDAVALRGESPGDDAGYAVAMGPVFDADGADDLVVSARRWGPRTAKQSGKVYVVRGGAGGGTLHALATPDTRGREWTGSMAFEGLGESLAVADFVPGGLQEIAIGATGTRSTDKTNVRGRVYVLGTTTSRPLLDGTRDGISCSEGAGRNDLYGFSLSPGDFNGDGAVDLAIGAIYADRPEDTELGTPAAKNSGAVYFHTSGFPDTSVCEHVADDPGVKTIYGHRGWDQLGFALASGRVDGDARDDLLLSARWHDFGESNIEEVDEGAVYLLQGSNFEAWPSSNLICADATNLDCSKAPPAGVGAMIFGGDHDAGRSDEAGFALATGDINGNGGFADIAISSLTHNRVYLLSLNNQDTGNPAAGQQQDELRDLRDADDDGDGYPDVQEDCNADGVLDANESDPLVPNRDVGVTIAAVGSPDLSCDNNLASGKRTMVVTVRNESARLSVAQADLILRVPIPDPFVYETGTTTIDGVSVSDLPPGTLPSTFPFQSDRSLTASALTAGSSITLRFTIKAKNNPGLTSGSTLTAVAERVSDEMPDAQPCASPAPHSNASGVFIALLCPDLTIARTCPGTVVAGTTTILMLNLANDNGGNASATANGVVVTNVLPTGITLGATSGECTNNPAGSPTCTLGMVPALGVRSYSIVGNVDPSLAKGSILVHPAASASSTNKEKNDQNDSTPSCSQSVLTLADLSLRKSSSAATVNAASPLTYTLVVTNAGPSFATNVTVTDAMPAGTTGITASGTGWACGVVARTVTCTRPSLGVVTAPGITINVTSPAEAGMISNTANVNTASTDDPNTSNNTTSPVSTTVTAVTNLSITKSGSAATVNAHAALTYTVTVANGGPSTATLLSVTDTLPAGVTGVAFTGTDPAWDCPAPVAGVVTCTRASLTSGSASTIRINLTSPAEGGPISNVASVTSAEQPIPVVSTPPVTTDVLAVASLSMVKVDNADPVRLSAPFAYSLAVTNAGPSAAATVQVTDTLPAGIAGVTFTGSDLEWTCHEPLAGVVGCGRSILPAGSTSTIVINVTAPGAGGVIANTASVTSAENAIPIDSNTETTNVSNLSVSKVDSVDPVQTGAPFSYTITVLNDGLDPATDIIVTDTLPPGVTGILASGPGWTCPAPVAGELACTTPWIGAGPASPIVIDVLSPSTAGSISNTATVESAEYPGAVVSNEVTTTVSDLSIEMAAAPETVDAGGALTYTLTATNNGFVAASMVEVIDTLPAGVSGIVASGPGWTCDVSGRIVTCAAASIGVGPAAGISIDVKAPGSGGTIDNAASVTSAENPASVSSNTVTTTVNPPPPGAGHQVFVGPTGRESIWKQPGNPGAGTLSEDPLLKRSCSRGAP